MVLNVEDRATKAWDRQLEEWKYPLLSKVRDGPQLSGANQVN